MVSDFIQLATLVGQTLQEKSLTLATAESCTGGLASQIITAIPGSSSWFDRGFVTYNNQAKQELLDVSSDTLEQFGPVSQDVAKEMAEGTLKHSHAQTSLSITGIAGPEGGTPETPIGTVCFAWTHTKKETRTSRQHFTGNRQSIREQAVFFALQQLVDYL